MRRVAICDDQPESMEELKKLLLQTSVVGKVHTYSDIDTFWAVLEDGGYYDVVFMDIKWGQDTTATGIDFAERLYEKCPYTRLVYVTAYAAEYVEDIFLKNTNLSGFLTKPVRREQLVRNLEKIEKEQSVTAGKLLIYYQGSHIAIPFCDILYLESRLHKTNIVLKEREYLCNERLEKLKAQLGGQFLRCHKSYVVNMEYIKEFQGREIVLINRNVIPVSKARMREAKDRFFSYISEQV